MKRLQGGDFPFARSTMGVLAGFAGLLLLMAALIFDSGRQIRDVTLDTLRLRTEYRERDALLDELRTNIYHASTLTRDYLLTPGGAGMPTARAELQAVRLRNGAILTQYSSLVLPGERQSFDLLRRRADAYLAALAAALPAQAANAESLREAFFRDFVLPRRSELIELAAQINAFEQKDLDAGEARIQTLNARFQRRAAAVSLVALLASAVLALIVVFRHHYLERQAAQRLEELRKAKHDLSLLSDRLVAAQEEERRKLSRELHDEVGQSMTAMLMELGRLESRLSGRENCREILSSLRRTAEENVARVRDLALLLRPSMLDELGLVPALDWQVREVTRRTGLTAGMTADEFDDDLPEASRTCVYRVVQELLHNCVKHARASEARVVLRREAATLVVSVQDNGVGFDPKQRKGLGLLGIEERVARLGGRFRVDSGPAGTTASVCLPLPARGLEALQAGAA